VGGEGGGGERGGGRRGGGGGGRGGRGGGERGGERREGGKEKGKGGKKVCNYNVEFTLICHFSSVVIEMEVSVHVTSMCATAATCTALQTTSLF